MKKLLYIAFIVIVSIGILLGLFLGNNNNHNKNNIDADAENLNIAELKVTNVYADEYGKFIDFEDNTGYYIGVDGYLWESLKNIKVGNIIIIDTMGTESIEDDVVIGIK